MFNEAMTLQRSQNRSLVFDFENRDYKRINDST
jgi:hypothetical protein